MFTCRRCPCNDRKDLCFTNSEAWAEHIKKEHGWDLSTRPARDLWPNRPPRRHKVGNKQA
jgi:uncharacterized C2H2 Zn-finger protein